MIESKEKEFYTRKEVQERLGCSLAFIDKRLPRIKIGGKIFVPAVDLERLLKGERVDAAA
ncbi:helix-turn-helix domain-containing protein [Methylorubrum sp. SL192]|uniref:helix-turn-helix domain-containing protein n=1 Tax=Methylorubrum sp. SL192 TaxID=2995167 RepID=UPI0022770335|nr:helix-turn-helix domain-containing protein [Methylorubrum sp. SL192]MCY1642129.1 helix-turn-helix domain-containing protein [Methylorubrum sp. SL192]